MSGDAPGVYLATLDCTSNEPTLSPTRAPVDHPITPHPSAFPSAKPIAPSQAATTPSATHTTDTATPIISTFEPSKSPTKRPIKHTFVSSQAESTRETGENGDDNEQATGDNDSDSLRTIFYIMVSLMCFCCVCNCIVFGMKKNSNFMNDMKNVTRFWKQDIVTDNVIQITLSSNVHQVMSGEEEIGNGQCRKDRIGDGGGVQKSFNLQHIIYGASEGVMGEQKDQSDSEDLFRDMGTENAGADTTTGTGSSPGQRKRIHTLKGVRQTNSTRNTNSGEAADERKTCEDMMGTDLVASCDSDQNGNDEKQTHIQETEGVNRNATNESQPYKEGNDRKHDVASETDSVEAAHITKSDKDNVKTTVNSAS
eukprot:428123_1